MREIRGHRVFDGKRYGLEYSGRFKEGAQSVAKGWRAVGGRARIVPIGVFTGTKPRRARFWAVYVRGSKEVENDNRDQNN